MSPPVTASRILAALREEGLTVRTYQGWETHNRNSHKEGWDDVHGVGYHHFGKYVTVAGAVAYARKGDPKRRLPGPLYNIMVDPFGIVHMVGWGRANHAGLGDADVLKALITESTPYPRPDANTVDMNSKLYGVCFIHSGEKGATYPAVQLDAGVRVGLVLLAEHADDGWTEASALGHGEWQKGKTDPSYDMRTLRKMMRAYRRGGRRVVGAPATSVTVPVETVIAAAEHFDACVDHARPTEDTQL